MRIYKGDVGVELTTEAFLEVLEDDALDDVIHMVLDLEETGSIAKSDDVVFMAHIDLDNFDGDNMDDLFEHITNNMDSYEIISEEDFTSVFGSDETMTGALLSDEEIVDNLKLSNEDNRVKRIASRFSHISDAS